MINSIPNIQRKNIQGGEYSSIESKKVAQWIMEFLKTVSVFKNIEFNEDDWMITFKSGRYIYFIRLDDGVSLTCGIHQIEGIGIRYFENYDEFLDLKSLPEFVDNILNGKWDYILSIALDLEALEKKYNLDRFNEIVLQIGYGQ